MAIQHNFQDPIAFHFHSDSEDVSLNWKSISGETTAPETPSAGFDCNICLDSARDPVVTLCGHLYCWPCIYKWLQVKTTSPDSDHHHHHQNCPVCKATITPASLVPLYGRGPSEPESEKPEQDQIIPRRPPPTAAAAATHNHPQPPPPQPEPFYHHHQMMSVYHPTVGMFGEMVYERMFGGSGTGLFADPNINSYANNARMRRQEMQIEESLRRVTIFLFCGIVLCLLLF